MTNAFISEMVSVCANEKYFPRVLSATQVSFKKVDPKDIPQKTGQGNDLKKTNSSSNGKKNKSRSTSDDEYTVHDYLAFALVLPKHPFSYELIDSLQVVAPMFPSITIYFGIGYEFHNMCAQYNVRSFPKLLFFHKGILARKYGKKRDAATIAYHFSKWTKQLPRAVPATASPRSTAMVYHYNSTWLPESDHWAVRKLDQILVNASAGRSIEPIITLYPDILKYDFEIFVASGLYVLMRALYTCFSTLRKSQIVPSVNSPESRELVH
eukprot:CAMPEP_0185039176 /NCGR_PEP_ID=MMETSP1103-20130426/35756_1 /TAXON_ID=36769 /ORGANISM="Paraphysomonas bandaiensis, Strain Caron Lab Isolate" /LENGTH=266 /DNA_ID=CAMNT_0027577959 /DNA_START=150 /DNA_END=950 /DNA_ORIENTATION=+